MEAGALSYRIISAGANIGNLRFWSFLAEYIERVPSIVIQVAV